MVHAVKVKNLGLAIAALLLAQGAQAFNAPQIELYTLHLIGDSMVPSIHDDEWVFVDRHFPFNQLRSGYVVWFNSPLLARYNWNKGNAAFRTIHRLTRQSGKVWRTKGDANPFEDLQGVTPHNYLGRVVGK
jgi:signal peptidase I